MAGSHSCATSGRPPVIMNASNASKAASPVIAAMSDGVNGPSTISTARP
jgi:hypothetical protein